MKVPQVLPKSNQVEKVVFQESYFSIIHNQEDNWLYVSWQDNQTEETLLRGSEHMLKWVKSTGSTKLINDSSNFTQTWPNLINWWAENYAPRLQEAGLEYFAWIYGDKNVIKPTADAILQKEKSDILVMVFDNLKTAETWLRSVR